MSYDEVDSAEFTENAWEALYSVVDNKYFQNKDAEIIYSALANRLKFIPFGEYLKRYIYRKAGLTEPFEAVSIKEYQKIIKSAFSDNHTPQSFEVTSAKLSALSKNWLTQQTVNRKIVFLLGFGLAMSVNDVNEFLIKALREQGINPKSPFEVICWYCYKNKYNYLKFEKLWNIYREISPNSTDTRVLYSDQTISVRNTVYHINNDEELYYFLSILKANETESHLSVTARHYFDKLFEKSRELVAEFYNEEEEEKLARDLSDYQEQLLSNDRITDSERWIRIENKRAQKKVYRPEDITESDLEHIISSAIPVDRHGNLTPSKASKLNAQFAGKRFSRQHISEILSARSEVTRFDLITLNFFIYSQKLDQYSNSKSRYMSFLESTNTILEACYLGELYISNPYECFVLMCILSDDPLGTYADVWEKAYE